MGYHPSFVVENASHLHKQAFVSSITFVHGLKWQIMRTSWARDSRAGSSKDIFSWLGMQNPLASYMMVKLEARLHLYLV